MITRKKLNDINKVVPLVNGPLPLRKMLEGFKGKIALSYRTKLEIKINTKWHTHTHI